jgi:hypothetical protein
LKAYDATSLIHATPAAVWAVLVDAAGYPAWDSGVERVEGTIAPASASRLSRRPTRAAPSP